MDRSPDSGTLVPSGCHCHPDQNVPHQLINYTVRVQNHRGTEDTKEPMLIKFGAPRGWWWGRSARRSRAGRVWAPPAALGPPPSLRVRRG